MDPQSTFTNTPPAPISPIPSKSSKKDSSGITVLAMAVFVLLALGAVAFLYYQNQQLKTMLASYQSVQTPSPTPFVSPEASAEAETANWKTYTNDAGFSFKYPENFTAEEPAQFGSPSANPKSTSLFIYNNSDSSSTYYNDRYINIDVNKNKPNFTEPQTQTTLGGIPATKYTFSNINFDAYLVQVGTNYIDIYVSNDPTKKELANQILSTFKFTGQKSAMKTCSNSDLKISLSIPSDWNCNSTETTGAGWIKITSSVFEINMAALGRGAFCDPGSNDPSSPRYDPTNSCQTTDFYTKNGASIKLYTLNQQNKEIFGTLGVVPGPWISIKWQNMETTNLTTDQKNQIISIIDSIKSTK